jgi:hypothetical protein
MEKVWRPISVWERRPVTSLNGSLSGCFRKKSVVFVNKCKTGNSIPIRAAAFWRMDTGQPYSEALIPFKNNKINTTLRNWHTLRLSPCKTAI